VYAVPLVISELSVCVEDEDRLKKIIKSYIKDREIIKSSLDANLNGLLSLRHEIEELVESCYLKSYAMGEEAVQSSGYDNDPTYKTMTVLDKQKAQVNSRLKMNDELIEQNFQKRQDLQLVLMIFNMVQPVMEKHYYAAYQLWYLCITTQDVIAVELHKAKATIKLMLDDLLSVMVLIIKNLDKEYKLQDLTTDQITELIKNNNPVLYEEILKNEK
jgi:hypothetical protein